MNSKLRILVGGITIALSSTTGLSFAAIPKSYPLKTCVVSGDELGAHAKPVKMISGDTVLYLCCTGCVEDFNKSPQKYLKILKRAAGKKGGT